MENREVEKEPMEDRIPGNEAIEEDQESVLSNIDFNGQDGEVITMRSELNLSEYCVSSDADTEKMDDDDDDGKHPPLKELVVDAETLSRKRSLDDDATEDVFEDKKPKLERVEASEVNNENQGNDNHTETNDTVPVEPISSPLNTMEDVKPPVIPSENTTELQTADQASNEISVPDKETEESTPMGTEERLNEEEDTLEHQSNEKPKSAEPVPQPEEVSNDLADTDTVIGTESKQSEDQLHDVVPEEPTDPNSAPDNVEAPVEAPVKADITKENTDADENGPEESEVKEGEKEEEGNDEEAANNIDEDEGAVGDADDDEDEDDDIDEDEEDEEDSQTVDNVETSDSSKKKKRKKSFILPMVLEERRQQALKDITEIEHSFAELRQKLYENKLRRLETELQMCVEGSHPELHEYYEKISKLRDFKLHRTYQRQKYELKCIDIETRATRTMIHQNFLRCVNELRSQLLQDTTTKWYDINKERRDMDIIIPDINYHVPVKTANKTLSCITGYAGPAQPRRYLGEPLSEDLECENISYRYNGNPVDKLEVIVDRMRLNNELSDLEGLKKYYHAFPGAPSLSTLRDSEIQDDFNYLRQ